MPPVASVPGLSIELPAIRALAGDPAVPSATVSKPAVPPVEAVAPRSAASVNIRFGAASIETLAPVNAPSQPPAGTTIDPMHALGAIWLTGTAAIVAWTVVRLARFRRLLQSASAPASAKVLGLAERAAARLAMPLRADILITKAHGVPFVWWCFGRPSVVLPASLVGSLPARELLLVLTHELAHVRRRDHFVRWLDWAVVAWFWWNPLAWLARRGLRASEELACDALVLRTQDTAARDYGHCLVSVAESMMTPAFRAPAQACTMGDGGSLEERIRLIMSGTLRTRPSAALRTLTLAIAGASMLFGVACAGPAQSTSDGGSSSSTRGSSSTSSSISFKKDGKVVSIEENGSGITVTVDGKSVRARNLDELKQQHPDAYRLYVEKPGYTTGSAGGSANASGSAGGSASASGSQSSSSTKGSRSGSPEGGSSASDLLREKLKELQRERPDDPRLQRLIEKMLQEADSAAAGTAQDAAPAPAPAAADHDGSTRTLQASIDGASGLRVSSTNGSITVVRDDSVKSMQITAVVGGDGWAEQSESKRRKMLDGAKLVAEKNASGLVSVSVDFPWDSNVVRINPPSVSITVRTAGLRSVGAESLNGSVRIEGDVGAVNAKTTNGSIDIAGTTSEAVAESANGNVTVAPAAGPAAPIKAESTNGSVRLDLPASWNGTLTASVTNGKVTSEGIKGSSDRSL
ncbi:MAG: M56 family metallopeptidase, partial [Phycisphaerales bacterium]